MPGAEPYGSGLSQRQACHVGIAQPGAHRHATNKGAFQEISSGNTLAHTSPFYVPPVVPERLQRDVNTSTPTIARPSILSVTALNHKRSERMVSLVFLVLLLTADWSPVTVYLWRSSFALRVMRMPTVPGIQRSFKASISAFWAW